MGPKTKRTNEKVSAQSVRFIRTDGQEDASRRPLGRWGRRTERQDRRRRRRRAAEEETGSGNSTTTSESLRTLWFRRWPLDVGPEPVGHGRGRQRPHTGTVEHGLPARRRQGGRQAEAGGQAPRRETEGRSGRAGGLRVVDAAEDGRAPCERSDAPLAVEGGLYRADRARDVARRRAGRRSPRSATGSMPPAEDDARDVCKALCCCGRGSVDQDRRLFVDRRGRDEGSAAGGGPPGAGRA